MSKKTEEVGKKGSMIKLVVFDTNPKREIFRDYGQIKLFEPIKTGSSVKKFFDSETGVGITNTVRSIEPTKEEGKFLLKTIMYRECEVTLIN